MKSLAERGAIFVRRRAEAQELGLWRTVATEDEAEARRAELDGLGFEDWDSDRWEKMVAVLRAAKAERP